MSAATVVDVQHSTSKGDVSHTPEQQHSTFLQHGTRIVLNAKLATIVNDFGALLQRLNNDGDIVTHKIMKKQTPLPIAFQLLLIGGIKPLFENPEAFLQTILNRTALIEDFNKDAVKIRNVEAALRGLVKHHGRIDFEKIVLPSKCSKANKHAGHILVSPNRINEFFAGIVKDFKVSLHQLAKEGKFISHHLPRKLTHYAPTRNIIYQLLLIFGIDSMIGNPAWFATQVIHFSSWLNNKEKMHSDVIAVQRSISNIGKKYRLIKTEEVAIFKESQPAGFRASKVTPEAWEELLRLIKQGEGSSDIVKELPVDITRQNVDYYKKRLEVNPEYTPNFATD